MNDEVRANPGKRAEIVVDGVTYERRPIRTSLVVAGDALEPFILEFAAPELVEGDILFVTEKVVAITQGRSYPVDEICSRPLAKFLSDHVTKTQFGIGLGIPQTMEMALREVGTLRILFAAGVAAVTKAFGRKGDFYRIAGPRARGIDGPTAGTIPPYNTQVVLAPAQPRRVARELSAALGGRDVAIVDINDFGGNVLGSTLDRAGERRLVRILSDNPLGQGRESTPLGVVRVAS